MAEKTKISKLLEPCNMLTNVLYSINEDKFQCEFGEFCSSMSKIFILNRDLLHEFTNDIESRLPQTLFEFALNKCEKKRYNVFNYVMNGLLTIQKVIPDLVLKVKQVSVELNYDMRELVTFDRTNMYLT